MTDELMVLVEERGHFRALGWDDRRIADRLGMSWSSYTKVFERHPELGELTDPVAANH